MSVTFARATAPTGSVTISLNPQYGSGDPIKFLQPKDRTAGNVPYVYIKGVNEQSIRLSWDYMSEADYQNLLTFFRDTVIGASYSFTYTDENSVAWSNCLLWSDEINFTKSGPGERSGEIELIQL